MRVVMDTNVLFSLAMGGQRLQPIRNAWETGRFTVLVSEELLAELADVFSRPQTERYLRPDRASRFMSHAIGVSE
jgi:predicted nucleic acid-binding protein